MLIRANFAKQAAAAKGHMYFIRTQDECARDVYFVLQVSPSKEHAFRRAMQGLAIVDYASFGAVIAGGFGHVPDKDTVAMLQRDYDYALPE